LAKLTGHRTQELMFSFGYWGQGGATRELVTAVNAAEAHRGFAPPLWVDIRISRSVRALGFRDGAFAQLLGAQYVWMPDLGNVCVREHRDGIEIKDPAAAELLLDLALQSSKRRVIFFCSCERPQSCHRQTVAGLVARAARRRRVEVAISEWPGGSPVALELEVSTKTLRAIARRSQKTLPLPTSLTLGMAASLPWASTLTLHANGETVSALTGPAQFSSQGARLPILAVNPGAHDARGFRENHGYEVEV
jgi:hypothetical protein